MEKLYIYVSGDSKYKKNVKEIVCRTIFVFSFMFVTLFML